VKRQHDKEMLLRAAMVLQEICIDQGLIGNHVKMRGRMLELISTCVVYSLHIVYPLVWFLERF
jgi:hypothetical protein